MDKAPKIENAVVERELSSEEKKTLAVAWFNLVLGRKNDSTDVEGFNNEQMRAWLYDSLISETLVLRNEWNINPDLKKYQEAIISCKNDKEKSDVEFKFINFFIDDLCRKMAEHPDKKERLQQWESWPKAMRESGSFNCVGGTLLSIASLEEAGIEVIYGNPAGHAIAIAKLKDGSFVFIDSNNFQVLEIVPEKKEIDGVSCFVIQHPAVEYEIIPIYSKQEIVHDVMLNLGGVKKEMDKDEHKNPKQKERTTSIYKGGLPYFESVDFGEIKRNLYGPAKDPWNLASEDFKNESGKVSIIHALSGLLEELKVSKELKGEIKMLFTKNPQEVEAFLLDLDAPKIPGASAEAMVLFEAMHRKAWGASGRAEAVKMACRWLTLRYQSKLKNTASTAS